MTAPETKYILGPSAFGDQSNFKKHKVLPHPMKDRAPRSYNGVRVRLPRTQPRSSSSSDASSAQARVPSLRKQSRRISSAPEPPPTPPSHSRSSSSTQSVLPSSPTYVATPEASTENVARSRPSTPPNQKRLPTPDITPPDPTTRPTVSRPPINSRMLSAITTATRTESYHTARDVPYSSDDDKSEKSTLRPLPPSTKTSQSTVRRVSDAPNGNEKATKPVGLGLGLESADDDDTTPKHHQGKFVDAERDLGSGDETRNGDGKRQRLPTAPLTPGSGSGRNVEVLEDVTVSPTNATKALRSLPLQYRLFSEPSPNLGRNTAEETKFWSGPLVSQDDDLEVDDRRVSMMSTKSTVSTVVEAILVDAAPQRSKTLRHVRKQAGLRDSVSDLAQQSPRSNQAPESSDETNNPGRSKHMPVDRRHDSLNSVNSLTTGKTRRDIWKSGGIPVVVVPERRSSAKGSRPPSLRSTSSRRSKRSVSVGSAPLSNASTPKDLTPFFERSSRRGRAMSESSGSDVRTADYPPVVPVRRSSLSAPTSRNVSRAASLAGSRAGSLTKESLKAHDALQVQNQQKNSQVPEVTLQRAPTLEPKKNADDDELSEEGQQHLHVDKNGDPWNRRHRTPFSQASMDTTGTSAAEISEAMAMNIYPHQNSSVLMVDHSTKPSESSDESIKDKVLATNPKVVTTNPEGDGPATPPRVCAFDDVDSPLRNPRPPPEPPATHAPPAIQFIPATPSGLTPANEKDVMLGNYYEEMGEKPPRRPSLVQRTFSRRRYSEDQGTKLSGFLSRTSSRRNSVDQPSPGFLSRTFSLSLGTRQSTNERVPTLLKGKEPMELEHPALEKPPPEEHKLHPLWRSRYEESSDSEEEFWNPDLRDNDEGHMRYPKYDNRPPLPHRSLSSKLKRTFAILPIQDNYGYPVAGKQDRRTIHRTRSGNLRVVKRKSSDSIRRGDNSLSRSASTNRPYTAPDRASTAPERSHTLRHKRRFLNSRRGNGVVKPGSPSPTRGQRKIRLGLLEKVDAIPMRIRERRREKRSNKLRGMISAPREVRDGVGEVIKRGGGFLERPRGAY